MSWNSSGVEQNDAAPVTRESVTCDPGCCSSKRVTEGKKLITWVVDRSAAQAHAIRWLGDRYLLAKPVNASKYAPRERSFSGIFAEHR